jgi:hypothetical protein
VVKSGSEGTNGGSSAVPIGNSSSRHPAISSLKGDCSLSLHQRVHLLGLLLLWRSNRNLTWALERGSIESEAERGLLMGRNNLTIKYMNWTHCQKKQGRRRSAVFKNTDGSARTWMLA